MLKVRLQVFFKVPEAGKVKTRLTPVLTPQLAADVAQCLLDKTLKVALEFDKNAEIWIVEKNHNFQNSEFKNVHFQCSGDLGARLEYATKKAIASGYAPLVIGSDCPFIDTNYLQKAYQHLTQNDVVIGPALDGGYVLIGMSRFVKDIFTDIAWGSAKVFEQTRERLTNVSWAEMQPALLDIDNADDLAKFILTPEGAETFSPEILQKCSLSVSHN